MIGGRTRIAVTLGSLLVIACLGQPKDVMAREPGAEHGGLYRDLYVAITLAGLHCGAISAVAEEGPSDYSVQCQNGKRYRVYSTDGEIVRVVDRTPGVGPSPGAHEDHASRVARSLFAIVNLSGFDCDEVVRFERGPRLHYRLSCQNQKEYRISVVAARRVVVDRIP